MPKCSSQNKGFLSYEPKEAAQTHPSRFLNESEIKKLLPKIWCALQHQIAEDPQEATQRHFERLLARHSGIPAFPVSWHIQCARRLSWKRCRRVSTKTKHKGAAFEHDERKGSVKIWDLVEAPETPETLLERQRMFSNMSALLDALPSQQYKLLKLLYFDGYKRRDCARILRWTPRQVSRQRYLALSRLRQQIEHNKLFES